jgi:hypothetical protein
VVSTVNRVVPGLGCHESFRSEPSIAMETLREVGSAARAAAVAKQIEKRHTRDR